VPEGDFELREVEWTPARLAAAGLMLVVGTLHLALTTSTDMLRFAVLALGLLWLFVVYFTDLWRPRYYLVTAGYVALMAGVWVVSGTPMSVVGSVDTAAKVALIALCLYLVADEARDVNPEEPDS
jgi:MFS superfamily sulfate permease-like transporter